jgi:hypothetical protein
VPVWVVAVTVGAAALASCVRGKPPAFVPTPGAANASLWRAPEHIAQADLFYGPWGAGRAPDPDAVHRVARRKRSGVNPGMKVVDSRGREWSVKQIPPGGLDREASVEVAMSRVLSAVGYHQPAVYYLPRFALKDDWGTHTEVGGRFRLEDEALEEAGSWAWGENPFIGSREYHGLLTIMMLFSSSDLKDSNNSIYEYTSGRRVERWYVVRDIGSALGDTFRLAPRKSDPDAFERQPFIRGVRNGLVDFAYTGWFRKLVEERVPPEDVRWVCGLLSQLTAEQWRSAFRAAGYEPSVSDRFIRSLRARIEEGRRLRG